MLNTAQTDHRVLRVNMLDVMRSAVLRDGDGSDVFLLPTLADLSSDSGWSQIRSATSFAELLPNTGAPNLIRSSSIFASYLADREGVETNSVQCSDSEELVAHEGHFTLIQIQPSAVPTEYHRQDEYSNWALPAVNWVISPNGELIARRPTQPESIFDSFCDVVVSALDVLAKYVTESERNARESWKRLCRRTISSSAVSKNGHLSFLAPIYREVCVKTAARDHVVHLEVITLAEEQEAPGTSAVGQMLISGGKSWMRLKSSLLNLFLDCSEKTQPFGFIGAGLNFANAEAP